MNPANAQSYSRWFRETLGCPELIRLSGKRPLDREWTQGPRDHPEVAHGLLENWNGNLGMLTGLRADGTYLVVVDADLYLEGAQGALDALYALGLSRRTVTVLTGGGGEQLYFTSPVPIPSRPLPGYPGIDIKCVGGMVVVPYSVHPDTGELYEWEYGYSPEDLSLAPLPEPLITLFGVVAPASLERQPRDLNGSDLVTLEVLERHYGAHSAHEHRGYYEVTRPGKEHGTSATVGAVGPGVAHVFSSNWPGLPAGTYDARTLRARKGLRDPRMERLAALIPIATEPEAERLIRASAVKSRRQGWLWRDLIPEGHFMLTAGREELGKSAAMLWVSARLTCGELDGDYGTEPVTVVYCSLEDDADRILKPRAVAAGADLDRLWFLNPTGPGFDLEALAKLAPKLVVLDPISTFVMLPSANEHGEHAVRNALKPLLAYALEWEATVVGVRHVRKGGALESAYDAILGSRAWSAAPRAHLIFAPDRERTDAPGGLIFPRGNLTKGGVVHRYRLDEMTVALDAGGDTTVPLFVPEGAGVGIDLEAALRPAPSRTRRRGPDPEALEHAKEWLSSALTDGPIRAKRLEREARECGISEITLKRARKELGAQARPRSASNGKRQWWVDLQGDQVSEPLDQEPDPLGSEHPEIPGIEPNSGGEET